MLFTIHWSIYRCDIAQRPAHTRGSHYPPDLPTQLKIRVCVYTRFHTNCSVRVYPCSPYTNTHTCNDSHAVVNSLIIPTPNTGLLCRGATPPPFEEDTAVKKESLTKDVFDVEINHNYIVIILYCIVVGVYATLVAVVFYLRLIRFIAESKL